MFLLLIGFDHPLNSPPAGDIDAPNLHKQQPFCLFNLACKLKEILDIFNQFDTKVNLLRGSEVIKIALTVTENPQLQHGFVGGQKRGFGV